MSTETSAKARLQQWWSERTGRERGLWIVGLLASGLVALFVIGALMTELPTTESRRANARPVSPTFTLSGDSASSENVRLDRIQRNQEDALANMGRRLDVMEKSQRDLRTEFTDFKGQIFAAMDDLAGSVADPQALAETAAMRQELSELLAQMRAAQARVPSQRGAGSTDPEDDLAFLEPSEFDLPDEGGQPATRPPVRQLRMYGALAPEPLEPATDAETASPEAQDDSPVVASTVAPPQTTRPMGPAGFERIGTSGNHAESARLRMLPMGSVFEAVLVTGVTAPSITSAQNPMPVLLRIKGLARTPNHYRVDLSDCHVVAQAEAELATERVQMRLVSLSCVDADGNPIEKEIRGAVYGEDGKLGLAGQVDSSTARSLAMKSAAAGVIGGLGDGFAQQGNRGIIVGPDQPDYDLGQIGRQGIASGAADGMNRVADFYLDMAEQYVPTVSVNAQRIVQVVTTAPLEV